MAMYEEMRQLAENLFVAHRERSAAVFDIRTGTAEELAGFRMARQAMATEQQRQLGEEWDRLRSDVGQMRHDTAAFLEEANLSHQAMATSQRHRLDSHMESLRDEVGDLCSAAEAFVKELDLAHQAMAATQAESLGRSRARLASSVTAFVSDLNGFRQGMATEQDQHLDAYVDGLRADVDALRQDTRSFLNELAAAQEAMAADQKQQLATAHQQLAADVGDLRTGFQAELGAIRVDQHNARRMWGNLDTLLKQRRIKPVPSPRPTPALPTVQEPAPPLSPDVDAAGDDLTIIHGIGAGTNARLRDAGIRSFAQLASATPDDLRQILGEMGRLAKVEQWIEQARELMGSM
jgi:predicted flap endonuclease-1-like 5' DNA nuclease/outer membrane murein-binding lipoprotein Lpp